VVHDSNCVAVTSVYFNIDNHDNIKCGWSAITFVLDVNAIDILVAIYKHQVAKSSNYSAYLMSVLYLCWASWFAFVATALLKKAGHFKKLLNTLLESTSTIWKE